jgi:hypothetical protein
MEVGAVLMWTRRGIFGISLIVLIEPMFAKDGFVDVGMV